MLKKILKLDGAYELTKLEQKSINGGITKECADAIFAGICVHKGGTACPANFPTATSGGCCCGGID
ncbi:hypothetical protein SD960_06760 [Flavobacterium sp. MMLR14_040]|uniref:hypothetical protein n=1 Tax=Flavobacterium sp. MMLR14_040 TaxID=3093843 RepID=UPI00298FA6B5|nr:hypothetical protein [Flavobacterium sp. MMLR14_040]MDW8849787.1 hypothetical protein [Flavobacterium sp. MMLR14_040]